MISEDIIRLVTALMTYSDKRYLVTFEELSDTLGIGEPRLIPYLQIIQQYSKSENQPDLTCLVVDDVGYPETLMNDAWGIEIARTFAKFRKSSDNYQSDKDDYIGGITLYYHQKTSQPEID